MLKEKLTGKKCNSCNFLMIEPAIGCLKCGSEELTTIEFIGTGIIYTFTVVHVAAGHLVDRTPYVLAIIELTEGTKVLTIIDGADPQQVKIGDRVTFKHIEKQTGAIFQIASV